MNGVYYVVLPEYSMDAPGWKEYWAKYVELLSNRFNERDDNVKCNILETFQNLMKASVKIDESFYSDSNSIRMIK